MKKGLFLSLLLCISGWASAQTTVDALPSGGRVAMGQATINQTGNNLSIVQSSQRAVINWDSFNVGSQAKVEFVQPNAQASTLNRVASVSATQIDGMLKSNGQVVISNAAGVVFGKSAQVDVGSMVATTMDINDKDFMEGKSTFKGNGTGAVTNYGKIQTNDPKGFIALLAPEVRNEGYILAKGGVANTVALASGSQVTLDFRGDQLMTVKVDASAYKSLIENKRLVQVDGGMVVIAANSAAQLMGSVIKNTGRISTSSMVNNGGIIEILADTVQNLGTMVANAKGNTGNGGQISLKGNQITLADTSKIKANAKEQGNGGQIIVLSNKKTEVSGTIEAMGGKTSGNGGFVETSSKETLVISSSTQVSTQANNSTGKAGTWLLDPMDLLITTGFAQVISDALQNNNVTVQVQGNVCSGGSCTQNGSGNLTIDSGVTITKTGSTRTVLTFLADGTFFNYGTINQAAGSVLEVVIQAQDVNLAPNSQIEVNKVTVTAVNSVVGYGNIIGQGANPLVNILANVFNFHGAITVNANQSNTTTPGSIRITANDLTLPSTGRLEANGTTDGGTITLTANTTGTINIEGTIQTNGGNGRGGEINISDAKDIIITNNAIIQSNADNGGNIQIFTNSGDLILQNALIQTNGSNGRGGSIGISATKNTLIQNANIEARGFNQGGTILIGNDADNGTLPFSIYTDIDTNSVITTNALLNNQNQINPDYVGGFIETSAHTLNLLGTINAGRGGIWLIDPFDFTIGSTEAAAIISALSSQNVSILTSSSATSPSSSVTGVSGSGDININSPIYSFSTYTLTLSAARNININSEIVLNAAFNATASGQININANVSTSGAQTYTGAVNIASDAVLDTTFGIQSTSYSYSSSAQSGSYVGAVLVELTGAGGGRGGNDGLPGFAGGVGSFYTASFYLSSSTTLNIGTGSAGGAGTNSASASGGGSAGVNPLVSTFNGGAGGNAGGTGSSGGGGGGGAATIVRVGTSGVYLVAGGGGGGAGANNVSNDAETTGRPYSSSNVTGTYTGGTGGYMYSGLPDGGGSGGGGGGTSGGAGGVGTGGYSETTGKGGYGGGSGAITQAVGWSSTNITGGSAGNGSAVIKTMVSGVNAGAGVTFSSTVTGNASSYAATNRLILTGDGAYQVWSSSNAGYFNPVGSTSGTATVAGTANSTGVTLSYGTLNGTLKWNGTDYSWIPNNAVVADYLVVGGGASGTRGIYGVYWGQGGGAGQVLSGTMSFNGSSTYTASVGAGGPNGVTASGGAGNAGSSSSLASISANGGQPGNNTTTGNAGAIGGTSGSGNLGGNGGATAIGTSCGAIGGYCGAGGGGGSGGAGSGINGGAGTASSITGTQVYYAGGGAGRTDSSYGTAAAGGGVAGAGKANTGGGGSDTGSVGSSGGSGLVVMAFGPGLTIKSGSAQVIFGGGIGNLSSLSLVSSAANNSISNAANSNFAVNYSGTTAGTLTLSASNTYVGNLMINSGTLKLSSTTPVGPSSGTFLVKDGAVLDLNGQSIATANSIILSGSGINGGGSLINSSNTTTASYAGAISLADNSSIGGAGSFTVDGVISGASKALTKVGAGTVTLTATNTYSGATTISAGSLVIRNNAPTLNSSLYSGAGTLTIEPVSSSFTSTFALTSAKIDSTLGGLTIGKSGNSSTITTDGNISVAGNLIIYGPSSLGGNITTSGTQEYTGHVTISATNVTLQTTNSSITFGGNINGTAANTNSLYLLSGSGAIDIAGNVGNTYALNYFGLGGTGQYVAGITANYSYTGAVQTFTATYTGTYTFYVWGAEGGGRLLYPSFTDSGLGGLGGYSSGSVTLTAGQTIYIVVGGAGQTVGSGVALGGYNGGGSGYASSAGEPGSGGGGATHIASATGTLNALSANRGSIFLVAGGGGGGGEDAGDPYGHGGGASGVGYNGSYDATQTTAGANGSFGQGANTWSGSLSANGGGDGGGGGGGFFGGGTSQSTLGVDTQGGGGGSGYIGGVSNGVTIAGNALQTAPGGGTQTGQSGNGYARVVLSEATSFSSGAQTGTVTIGGAVNATNIKTGSGAFQVKIGQTVASGTSNWGASTTLNNTGGFVVGTASNPHTLSVTGSFATAATGLVKLSGSVITTTTQTYNAAVELAGDTTLSTTDSAVTLGVVNSSANAANDLTVTTGTAAITVGDMGTGTDGALGAVNLTSGAAMTLNAVNATGSINVATLSGNLTVAGNVTTTDTSDSAITLNAGKSTAAGTTTGGNIIISGSPTITVGTGGRATFYTGSISGSTGLTSLIGSGSGKFRYNSDESATNYSTALSSGKYAIYRERPSLTIDADDQSMTYGDATPTLTATVSGHQNGDTDAQVLSGGATLAITASGTSTSGNYTYGTHTIGASGATSALGYSITYTTGTLTVAKRSITVSGITASNKTYNGNTTATVSTTNVAYANKISGDVITISTTGLFNNKNAADGKTVTLTSTYAGADVNNYSLTPQATTTANITQKALNISGLTAANKTYDGGLTASLSGAAGLTGSSSSANDGKYIGTETVGLSGTAAGAFDTKNYGTGKTVTISGLSLTGTDAGNYTLNTYTTTANITQKALDISGLTAANKTYDGGLTATLSGTAVLTGSSSSANDGKYIGTETVSLTGTAAGAFDTKNYGTGKTVTISGLSLAGADAGNYTLNTYTRTANITQKALDISGLTAANKTYDGGLTASLSGTAVLTGSSSSANDGKYIGTETVSLTGTAAGVFDTKNYGTGKTVTISGLSLDGADAGNYTLNTYTTTADIDKKSVTLTAPSVTKAYDGLTTYTVTAGNLTSIGSTLVGGDTVTAATITYADKNVGAGNKTVTLSGITISDGNNGDNYTVTLAGNSSSTITRQSSVTWIGGSTGDWFNPANWAVTGNLGVSGAVPDLANVQAVVIGSGKTVTFDDSVSGRTSPAQTGLVEITTLSGGGSLTVTNGSLSATSLNVVQLNTSSGTSITTSSGITVAPATSTTDTIAGVLAGNGSLTKNGAGTTVLSGANTYSGTTTIGAGVLKLNVSSVGTTSSITSGGLGASSATVSDGAVLDLNGKTLLNALTINGTGISSGSALINSDGSNAATVSNTVALATNSSMGGAGSFTVDGVISGASKALTKVGAGTVTLTATNTYSGATTISAGALVIQNNAPTLNSSLYSGAGSLMIEPVSSSFTSSFALASAKIDSTLGGLTVGKSGNSSTITTDGSISVAGNLIIYGPSSLGGNITTSGTQEYTGNATISATNVTLQTTNSSITFGGNINGTAANTNSLYLLSGSGAINITGNVGNTYALSYFGLGGTGQYVAGTTTNFSYTGAVQTFTATYAGTYTFYVWGAQGGGGSSGFGSGGTGGYAYGDYSLTAGQVIYVVVGQQGFQSASSIAYNGGGSGSIVSWSTGAGDGFTGGGATSIATANGTLQSLSSSQSSVILVAGGGGGAGGATGWSGYASNGGAGGGSAGSAGQTISGRVGGGGGTQSAGGSSADAAIASAFGLGATGSKSTADAIQGGGGGGGYYGGGSGSQSGGGGGGGSSYIGGVTNGVTIAGNALQTAPGGGTQTGQSGNGYARVVLSEATSFSSGAQTGTVTIGGAVNATNIKTGSGAFQVKIGQTVASGTSNWGASTTLNNTGGFVVGTASNPHTLSVTGSFATAATGLVKLSGSVITTTTQTYNAAVELAGDTTLSTTDSAVTLGVVNSSANAANDLTVTTGTAAITVGDMGTGTDGALGAVNLTSGAAMTLNAVNATGSINVATLSGNLTVAGNVTTTDTSDSAITLNAGKSTAAGTTTGGNIIISGSPTITVGTGGRATFYTGSISGSTGLTSLIGSGSGKFRYNSDESATNYSTALSSGKYAIYRERPSLTIDADDQSMTYGDATPTLTATVSGHQNGDTDAQVLSGGATLAITASGTSTSGNYTYGTHTIGASGATSALGYSITYTTGTLTVAKRSITVSGITASNKTYNGNTTATVSTTNVAYANKISGDVITISTTGLFNNKNAADGKTVTLTSTYAGADVNNYSLTPQATTTANITQKALNISGLTAANKTYDGGLTASLSGAAGLTGSSSSANDGKYIGTETVGLSGTAAGAFDTKNYGTGKTVTISGLSLTGTDAGNYTLNTYTTTANITQKALDISGLTAANKTYDGGLTATLSGTAVLTGSSSSANDGKYIGTETVSLTGTAAGAFDTKNYGTGKTVTISGLSLAGADAGNYTLNTYTRTANITQKALDISGLTAANKTYDGGLTASLSGTAVLTGSSSSANDGKYIGTETVSLTGTAAGVFDTKNYGTGKTVTISGLSLDGADAGNYTLNTYTTTADIDKKSVTLTAPSVTKAYDGLTTYTVTAGNLTSIGSTLVGGDTVTAATITYADKNVGAGNKTVTLSGITISDGNNGDNYTVTLAGNSSSTITRQSSVTWIGGSTGDWFNPANWAVTGNLGVSGAVPDLANVQAVVIGSGKTVTFDDSVSGRTSPAQTGLVEITTLSGGGSLTVTNGSLSATSLNVVQLNTSSGTSITTSSGITVAPATSTTDTIAGVLAGNGSLTKNGAGTTVLSGANTYSGTTTIGAGVLQVGAGSSSGVIGSAAITNNGVLNIYLSSDLTLSQNITGSGVLTQSGENILMLSGSNSFTGGVNVNSGTVLLNSANAFGSSGTIAFNGGVLRYSSNNTSDYSSRFSSTSNQAFKLDTNGQSISFASPLAGTGSSLIKLGAGNLTMSGANTYTGATNINTGSLTVTGSLSDSTAVTVASGATYNVDATDTIGSLAGAGSVTTSTVGAKTLTVGADNSTTSFSGVISNGSGTLNLVKSGSGVFTLSNTNTYTGSTTVSAGTLALSGSGSIATSSKLVTNGTFDISAASSGADVKSLDGSGSVILGSKTFTLTAANDDFAGVISGTGGLTLTSGTQALSGANTYTGTTTINAGILNVTGSLSDSTAVTVASGATYSLGASDTVLSIAGAGSINLNSFTLTAGDTNNQTFSGVISGTGSLVKVGTGALTLSGANTYTGTTTISAGILNVTGSLSDSTAVTVASGATYSLGASDTVLSIAGAGSINLNSFTLTAGDTNNQTFSGVISGTGSLVKVGTGALTLSGDNTYSGGTTVNAGTLFGGAGSELTTVFGSGPVVVNSGSTLWLDRATLANDITLNDATLQGTNGFGETFNGQITLTGNNTLANYFYMTLNGAVTGTGSFTKTENGQLTLAGNNTYSGTTTINAGTFTVTGSLSDEAALIIPTGSIFSLGGSDRVLSIAGSGAINLNGYTLTAGDANNQTFSGVISGTGNFVKVGSGTLTLAGNNTYSGTTTINAGTVVVTHNNGLGSTAGGTTVASGAVLDLYNVTVGAEPVTLAGGTLKDVTSSLAGDITLTANSTVSATNLGDTLTLSGVISGAYNLTKTGLGTVVLAGMNTYTGSTTISTGTLALSGSGSIATSSKLVANGTFDISATSGGANVKSLDGSGSVVLGSKTLTLTAANDDFAGVISGSGGLMLAGGTQTLSGSNTYTGGTTINTGTLALGANNVLADTGAVNIDGGTFDIGAYNDTVGVVTLSSGSIGGSTGVLSAYSNRINNSAGTVEISAILGGSSELTKSGSGKLILSGVNQFTGDVTIEGGILSIASDAALGNASSLIINGGALEVTGNTTSARSITLGSSNGAITTASGIIYTVSSTVSGSGSLTKSGSGVLTLSGANSYSGTTTINAGTLSVTGSLSDSTAVTVASGATYSLGASDTVLSIAGAGSINLNSYTLTSGTSTDTSFSGVMSGTGQLTKIGTGNLTMSGANTYSGATNINTGSLTVTGSLSDSTAVTVASGATYNVDATDTIGSLAGAGSVTTSTVGAKTLTVGADNSTTSFSGVISNGSGTLNLVKSGSGVFTLSNTNTYTGSTTVSAGTLALSGSGSIATSSKLVTNGTFDISAASSGADVKSLDGSGSVILGSKTFTLTAANDDFAGVISGTGGLTLTSGTQALSGANTYTGTTTINAGILNVTGSLSDSTAVTVASVATYSLGASDTVLSIAGAGSINLNSYTLTSGTSTDTSFSGVISGTGSLVKVGTGGLTLSGANTYSGGTTINGGTLFGGAGSQTRAVFGTGSVVANSGTTLWLDRATLANDIRLNNATLQGTNGFGETFNGQITLTGNNTLANYFYMTLNGAVTGTGSFTKTENGQLTLAGNNTYSGTTTINAGTVVVTHNNGLGSTAGGTSVASGAVLDLYNVSVGAEPVTLAGGTLKDVTSSLAGDITLTANSTVSATNLGDTLTLSGVISGAYNLTKTGLGTVVLAGMNTYTGSTTISTGTLALSGSGSIATSSKLVANGTFDISATSGGANVKSLDGSGSVVLGSKTLTLTAANDDFAGVISGSGGLMLAGGTQTLSGSNTYTGGTTINTGTLALGANNVLADTGAVNVDGGTFDIGTYNDTVGVVTVSGGASLLGSTGILSASTLTSSGLNAVNLAIQIRTANDQTWNTPITLVGNTTLVSSAGSIYFYKPINSLTAKQNNLVVEAFGMVDISTEVGLTTRIAYLTVTAPEIYIRGDIATAYEQEYNGHVWIGDLSGAENNTLFNNKVTEDWVGTDGYQSGDTKFVKSNSGAQLIRTFVSEDPAIRFNGMVDDTVDNTHGIIVLAISGNSSIPQISFTDSIGSNSPLYSLTVKTMYYTSGPLLGGSVTLGGNVSTYANQTYGATQFVLTSPTTTTLLTEAGRIKIDTSVYQMVNSLKLDYTFANQPEIASAAGLSRIPDTVRDAPIDLGAATIVSGFRRNAGLTLSSDDRVVADVQVGDIESSDKPASNIYDCNISTAENCYDLTLP